MIRVFLTAALISGIAVSALADVSLNIDTIFDYKASFYTNSSTNNFNGFGLGWGAVGFSGDISKNVKGNFLYDVTGNSLFTYGIWYSYFDWTVLENSLITVGLQDSVFGYTIPADAYARTIDLGVKWSQNFGVFGYSVQAIRGDISATTSDFETVFNGVIISTMSRKVPTFQGEITATPVKGLTLGVAGRKSQFDGTVSGIEITNNETGLEGYAAINSDLIPNLGFTADYTALFNTINYGDIKSTNANSYYFTADLNYTLGSVTPGFKYGIEDPNTSVDSTNDLNQWVDVYAVIKLTEDGNLKVTPFFQYNLTRTNSNTPEDIAWFRIRFEYQFNFPVYKETVKKESASDNK